MGLIASILLTFMLQLEEYEEALAAVEAEIGQWFQYFQNPLGNNGDEGCMRHGWQVAGVRCGYSIALVGVCG
jgi:hypothetical protein